MKKNGYIIAGAIIFVLVGVWGLTGFNMPSFTGIDIGGGDEGDYSYAGRNVYTTLDIANKYTAGDVNGTCYVYSSIPVNWENGRVDVEDGYVDAVTILNSDGTLTAEPETYYLRCQVSGYYDDFFKLTVPATGDETLNDYNDGGGEIIKRRMYDVEAISLSNVDLTIVTNELSDITYTDHQTVVVDDDEAFWLDEIKFQEDATYSFATDSDGDGTYDEGINKIRFTLDGQAYTPFDVASSVDDFAGDDEAVWDYNKLYEENDVISIQSEITCDATLNTTGDADEKCGDGEDFIDSTILVDKAGNTATYDYVG